MYHHCQCADQKTTGLRVLVVSPRKKYQSWKSEALLYHLRALPLHKTTKYAEFFLFTCPGLHKPLDIRSGKSSERKAYKSLKKKKKSS